MHFNESINKGINSPESNEHNPGAPFCKVSARYYRMAVTQPLRAFLLGLVSGVVFLVTGWLTFTNRAKKSTPDLPLAQGESSFLRGIRYEL